MKLPKILIGSLLACATIAALSPVASATTDAKANGLGPVETQAFDSTDAVKFWTPERMAEAAGPDGNLPAPKMQIAAASGFGQGENFTGINQVGTFFLKGKEGTIKHQCTGSVLDTPSKNLVLTAGHCLTGGVSNIVFVPKWSMAGGKVEMPFGAWGIEKAFRYAAYDQKNGTTPHLDLLIVRVAKKDNKAIGEVTGMLPTHTDDGWTKRGGVQMIGYPMSKQGAAVPTLPRRCANDIPTKGAKNAAVKNSFSTQMYCKSMVGGSSGGPWMDMIGKKWTMVAITGGEELGGVSDADTTAGLKLGKNFRSLLALAQKG